MNAWLKLTVLVLLGGLLGCQTIARGSTRSFPDADYPRLWLASHLVAQRAWTVVRADSTAGVLVARAGDGGRGARSAFEYRIQVAETEAGCDLDVVCVSGLFGRQLDLERLYIGDVADKYEFLSPRRRP